MAFEAEAATAVCEWLESHADHVVNVCAGPRREHWFNAEAFVALSHKARIDKFIVYGEQSYSTVLRGTAFLVDSVDGKKLPDIVGFTGDDIDFVIEGKVILRSDSDAQRKTTLWKLRDQVERAKRCSSSCAALGVAYLISTAGANVAPEPFYQSVKSDLEAVLNGLAWRWLRAPAGLDGLRLRTTSFDFPVMTISVGIAVFAL
jgi:hypothetical protein